MSELPAPVTSPEKPSSSKPGQNLLTTAKGSGVMFVGRVVAYTSRFAITFVLARFLGVEAFGLYNLARVAASMTAGISALGLDVAALRFIALAGGRKDAARTWGTLQVSLLLTALVSPILGLAQYLFAETIAVQIFAEPRLIPLLKFGAVMVPAIAMGNVVATAIRGFKEMEYSVIPQNIFKPLFRFVLILGLGLIGLNAMGALATFGIAEFAAFLLGAYFLNKLFSLKRPFSQARRDWRGIITFATPAYLSSLISTFGSSIQTIFLGALSSVTNAGIFTVASRVNLIGDMFNSSISGAVTPIIAELYGQKDFKQLGILYQLTTKWIFAANLPIFLVLVLFPNEILSIFGSSFVDGSAAMVLLAWGGLVNAVTGTNGNVLDMTGHNKLKLVNSVSVFILSIILNYIFIVHYGIFGAALASLISKSVSNFLKVLQVYLLLKLLPYNLGFLKPITATLIALAVVSLTARWFPTATHIFYIVPQIIIIFLVYGGVIYLLGVSAEEYKLFDRIRRRTNKKLLKR
jgi:O-antigen/teichoic acid export membrane protein